MTGYGKMIVRQVANGYIVEPLSEPATLPRVFTSFDALVEWMRENFGLDKTTTIDFGLDKTTTIEQWVEVKGRGR